jgi:uncharacterized BrkB/YihY/UPF0761 family membrane protein
MLLALAIVAMLWTTSGAIGVLERCESRILACPRHDVVTGRLRNILLGAVIALMVAAASAGAPVIGNVADTLNVRGHLPGGLLLGFNVLGSVAAFAVIYRFAPRSRLRWSSAGVGAVPAAVAIQFVPALVGLYVGAAAGYAAVRLFLLLAVVLFGLYAIALVMLVGAGVAVRRELAARGEPLVRPPAPGSPEHFAAAERLRLPGR